MAKRNENAVILQMALANRCPKKSLKRDNTRIAIFS